MRTETRAPSSRSGDVPVDPHRDPTRAAALTRLAAVSGTGPQPGTGADPQPGTGPGDAATGPSDDAPRSGVPWADLDPAGDRPARVPPENPDPAAWADPPWWGRIRWAPDRLAGVALVVLVLALGAFSVHRLLASVPGTSAVPDLPLAAPVDAVAEDGTMSSAASPSGQPAPTATPSPPTSGGDEATDHVIVSVVGLVGRSGLVTLSPGARVADALEAAGGVLEGGDRDGLNLARRVADGEQILVGTAPGPDGTGGPRSAIIGAESDAGAGAAPAPGAAGAGASDGAARPPGGEPVGAGAVDLNTADAAALESLPGVGPVTASAILAWRSANGPFTSVDQLVEVDGIGPATLARLTPLVTV